MERLISVTPKEPYILELEYSDGLRAVVDIAPIVEYGGVFKALEDPELFRQAAVHEYGAAVVWPRSSALAEGSSDPNLGGLDLDARALRAREGRHHLLEVYDPVSEEVARLVRESGLTQQEVAARLGVKQPNVARWVNPEYQGHSINTLRKLADALGARLVVRFERET